MNLIRSIAAGALLPVGLALALQVHLEPDQNNVCSGRLVGLWESDGVVSARLGQTGPQESIEFSVQDSFLSSVPESVTQRLKQYRIFETGLMVTREGGKLVSSAPYFLTSAAGNSQLLMLREDHGVPLSGIEAAPVFVAPGRGRNLDLLLLGTADKDEAFRSFQRVHGQP